MASSLDEFAEEASRGLLRQQNARLRSELRDAQGELEEALGRLTLLEGIDRLDPRPPKWTSPRKPGPRQAVVVAMLSDCHFDEIVRAWDAQTMEMGQSLAMGLYPSLVVEAKTVRETDTFLARDDINPALRRLVVEGRDGVSRSLRARAADV